MEKKPAILRSLFTYWLIQKRYNPWRFLKLPINAMSRRLRWPVSVVILIFPLLMNWENLGSLVGMPPYNGLRMNEQQYQLIQRNPRTYLENYGEEILPRSKTCWKPSIFLKLISCSKIHEAPEVVLMGYGATLEIAKEVQMSFSFQRKIYLSWWNRTLAKELLQGLNQDALILLISSYGTLLTKDLNWRA